MDHGYNHHLGKKNSTFQQNLVCKYISMSIPSSSIINLVTKTSNLMNVNRYTYINMFFKCH